MKNANPLPYVALSIGILSLSMSAMFVRWANAPGTVTGFYRLSLSTLILTPFFMIRQRRGSTIPIRVLVIPMLAGIFTAGDFSLWNSSLAFTTAAKCHPARKHCSFMGRLGRLVDLPRKIESLLLAGSPACPHRCAAHHGQRLSPTSTIRDR